jgi:hypothetical protein
MLRKVIKSCGYDKAKNVYIYELSCLHLVGIPAAEILATRIGPRAAECKMCKLAEQLPNSLSEIWPSEKI